METIVSLSQVTAPKTKRGEATLEKILMAAELEFGDKGFYDGSISGIASRAGIGQGTFYLYFKCKEDVLRELVLYFNRTIRKHLSEQVINATNRLDAERLGLTAFLTYIQEHPNLYRILQQSQFVDPEVHKAYYMSFADGYKLALEKAFENSDIRAGEFEAWSWSIMGTMHFIGQRYVIWDSSKPIDEVVDSVIDMLTHGLSA